MIDKLLETLGQIWALILSVVALFFGYTIYTNYRKNEMKDSVADVQQDIVNTSNDIKTEKIKLEEEKKTYENSKDEYDTFKRNNPDLFK